MTGPTPSPEKGLVASSQVQAAAGPATGGTSGEHRPQRRRWVTGARVIALVIVLPVVALLLGLLIAWIVHLIRGNPASHPAVSGPTPSASAAPSAAAPTKAPAVVVPSDWVAEQAPPAGVTFSHPVGWIRRTSLPEVLRFAPASPGSNAPGIEGVGAGIEATGTPAQAVSAFATRIYGAQPGFAVVSPAGPIAATSAGARPGEQQEMVRYQRSGIAVRVVIHSFTSGAETVLVLGRAANAQPARAAQLEAFAEASVKVN